MSFRIILLAFVLISSSLNADTLAQSVVAENTVKAAHGRACLMTRDLEEDELLDSAGLIFKGKLESIELHELNGTKVRQLKFQIQDVIKGLPQGTQQITLNEWAQTYSPMVDKVSKNETQVFCFYKPSKRGLTSLVGLDQGIVRLDRKEKLKFSKRLKKKRSRVKNYQDLKKRYASL